MNPLLPTFSHDRRLVVLFGLVVLSRLPFLFSGYGTDADAWRVAFVAGLLWETGNYEPSRLPGYPLHEFTSAPLVALGGAPVSNAATLVAMLVLLWGWSRFTATRSRHPQLLTACLAFTPLVWVNSATTIDYIWSILFLFFAFHATLNNRPLLAGVLLGVATGFRPANFIGVVPLAATLLLHSASRKQLIAFMLSAIVTTLVGLSPLLAKYGLVGWIAATQLEMSDIAFTPVERILFFTYRAPYAIGPLAIAVVAFIFYARRNDALLSLRTRDSLVISSGVWVLTFLVLFFSIPIERGYLLPALPFIYLLVDRYSTRNQFLLFTACIISFGIVNPDIVRHGGIRGAPGLNVHWGMVVEEYLNRRNFQEERARIAGIDVEGRTVIMTGRGPIFWLENDLVELDTAAFWRSFGERVVRKKTNREIRFVAGLNEEEVNRLQNAGYAVYCLANAREYLERLLKHSMSEMGVGILE